MMFRLLFFLSLIAGCVSCSTNTESSTKALKDTIDKAQENNKPQEEEQEEVEYIFEEKKIGVSEEQKKGIMLNIVRQYCQSQMEQDYQKLSSLFADSVQQYLFTTKISKEQVVLASKTLHKGKKNIRYTADYSKMTIKDYTLHIPIRYSWEGFSREVQAEIIFDEAFNIISYQETPLTKTKIDLKKLWEGQYELKTENRTEAYLEIKEMQDKKFSFKIEINSDKNCKEKFEGKAVLLNKQEASSIETDACKVIFSLKEGQISIEELPNCTLHGAVCSFAGVYTKTEK